MLPGPISGSTVPDQGVIGALMKRQKVIESVSRFSKPFRITDGENFKLKKFDPSDTLGLSSEDKPGAQEALATGIQALADLQDILYAQDNWAVILILQAWMPPAKTVSSSMSCPT